MKSQSTNISKSGQSPVTTTSASYVAQSTASFQAPRGLLLPKPQNPVADRHSQVMVLPVTELAKPPVLVADGPIKTLNVPITIPLRVILTVDPVVTTEFVKDNLGGKDADEAPEQSGGTGGGLVGGNTVGAVGGDGVPIDGGGGGCKVGPGGVGLGSVVLWHPPIVAGLGLGIQPVKKVQHLCSLNQ